MLISPLSACVCSTVVLLSCFIDSVSSSVARCSITRQEVICLNKTIVLQRPDRSSTPPESWRHPRCHVSVFYFPLMYNLGKPVVVNKTKTELLCSPITEDNFFDPSSAHVNCFLLPVRSNSFRKWTVIWLSGWGDSEAYGFGLEQYAGGGRGKSVIQESLRDWWGVGWCVHVESGYTVCH